MTIFPALEILLVIVLPILWTRSPCEAASPEWRYEYQHADFGGDHVDQRNQQYEIHLAFSDAIKLARLVAATFDSCEEVYTRYFKNIEAPFVRNMFLAIANLPANTPPVGPENLAEFLSQNIGFGVLSDKFAFLSISINDNPRLPQGWAISCEDNDEDDPTQAFFAQLFATQGNWGYLSVCDEGFKYPSLWEIENPQKWALDATGDPEAGFGCDGLLDHDNDYMMALGGIILHEMMHWPFLFGDVPNYNTIIDRAPDGQSKVEDWQVPDPPDAAAHADAYPPNGYGPYHAMWVNNLPVALQTSPFQSVQNADNYVYYALSKYWSFTCQRPFGPPVNAEDNSRRLTPNY